MGRIVAFGCSNTYGLGLPDNCDLDKDKPGAHPSEYAWPSVLAKKLNYRVVNNGVCGCSNKFIYQTILNYKFSENDICCVMWTDADRYWRNDSTFSIQDINRDWGHRHQKGFIGPWMKTKMAKVYYSLVHSEYDHDVMHMNYMYHLSLHMKKIKKQCVQYHWSVKRNGITDKKLNKWGRPDIHSCSFKKLFDQYPKAADDSHPGPLAHEDIAQLFYERIKEK